MSEFRFLGFLAERFGRREAEIPLNEPTRLRDILGVEFSEHRAVVLINDRVGDFDSLVEDGDKVVVMPIISGGEGT